MKIDLNKNIDEQLVDIKSQLNIQLAGLHRHCTGLSSTLLVLLTVFGKIIETPLLVRIPLAVSMTFLLLSLLVGLWCMYEQYRVNQQAAENLANAISEDPPQRAGRVDPRKPFQLFVKLCPILLSLGVLFLWTSGLLVLFL